MSSCQVIYVILGKFRSTEWYSETDRCGQNVGGQKHKSAEYPKRLAQGKTQQKYHMHTLIGPIGNLMSLSFAFLVSALFSSLCGTQIPHKTFLRERGHPQKHGGRENRGGNNKSYCHVHTWLIVRYRMASQASPFSTTKLAALRLPSRPLML